MKPTSNDGITRIEICFNMEGEKPSPRFESLSKIHGTAIGYHGTKIDRIWSILNYGLLSFSDSTFYAANGSIMGSGVYFCTSYEVASFFASSNGNSTTSSSSFYQKWAWRHSSVVRLLNHDNKIPPPSLLFDQYNISCLPIIEAQIINAAPNDKSNTVSTRREGKYLIVPNAADMKVTKLHLTFELTKRRSMPNTLVLSILFAVLG